MSGQNRKERKPWPIWGQFLALIVGIMLLFEGVYQANNAYLRYKLAPMFERAVREAEVPEIAIFPYWEIQNLCGTIVDECLEKKIDEKFDKIYTSLVLEGDCLDMDSQYCPSEIKYSLYRDIDIRREVGLFSDEIYVETSYVNGEISYITGYYTSIFPHWRPNIIFWLAALVFEVQSDNTQTNCYRKFVPTFKPTMQRSSCIR